ncbi:MAG: hypothetical protein KC620_12855, partial [Myxococcales bacterium]|nr:hypothetical protein [Myxococcales bacterium]
EDEARRLRAELALREARARDLDEMIATHERMESMLAEAVRAADTAREEEESARRLAEANLKLLDAEFARHREAHPGRG